MSQLLMNNDVSEFVFDQPITFKFKLKLKKRKMLINVCVARDVCTYAHIVCVFLCVCVCVCVCVRVCVRARARGVCVQGLQHFSSICMLNII